VSINSEEVQRAPSGLLPAAKATWAALQEGVKRVLGTLIALLNRRIDCWNDCECCQDAHAAKAAG
jgi:hypothetical protein